MLFFFFCFLSLRHRDAINTLYISECIIKELSIFANFPIYDEQLCLSIPYLPEIGQAGLRNNEGPDQTRQNAAERGV